MKNAMALLLVMMVGCAVPCGGGAPWLEVDGVRVDATCRRVDADTLEVQADGRWLVVKIGGGAPNGALLVDEEDGRRCAAEVGACGGALLVDADCEGLDVHAECGGAS